MCVCVRQKKTELDSDDVNKSSLLLQVYSNAEETGVGAGAGKRQNHKVRVTNKTRLPSQLITVLDLSRAIL